MLYSTVSFLLALTKPTQLRAEYFKPLEFTLQTNISWPCILSPDNIMIVIDSTNTIKSYTYSIIYSSFGKQLIQQYVNETSYDPQFYGALQTCILYDNKYIYGVPMDIGWQYPNNNVQNSKLFLYNIESKQYQDLHSYTSTPLYPSHIAQCMVLVYHQIYVIGGFVESNTTLTTNTVTIYDICNDSWMEGPHMLTDIALAGVAFINNKIYLFGGMQSDKRSTSSIYSLQTSNDSNSNEWRLLTATMKQKRNSHTCIDLDELVYCVGGRVWQTKKNEYLSLRSTEKFNTTSEEIIDVDINLNQERTFPSVVKIYEYYLLVLSGRSEEESRSWYDSVELMVPTTAEATPEPTLRLVAVAPTDTHTLTDDATPHPTMKPIYIRINAARNFVKSEWLTNVFVDALLSISFVFVVIGSFAYIDARCFRINDFFRISSIGIPLMECVDTMTDIFFSSHIYINRNNRLSVPFILSIIFIVLPLSLSIIQLYHECNQNWLKKQHLRIWLLKYSCILYSVSLCLGSSFSSVELFNSGIFDMELFDIGLSKNEMTSYKNKRLYSVVVMQNVPQLFIQGWVLYEANGSEAVLKIHIVTICSMFFSLISIIVNVLSLIIKKRIIDSQEYVVISLDVTGSALNIWKCRKRVKGLRKGIASILGVNVSCISMNKPRIIPSGVRLEICLFVDHAHFHGGSYRELFEASCQSTHFARLCQSHWGLISAPLISNVDYAEIESKNRQKNTVLIKIRSEHKTEMIDIWREPLLQKYS